MTINSGVVAAIHVAGVRSDPCGAVRWTSLLRYLAAYTNNNRSADHEKDSPTHWTTRVITYTCYMYCCHNTGIDCQDFKFCATP